MPVLIVDDVEVTVPEGFTIFEAATQAGIWIPTLCYYSKISPSDACRMCVVEIEGIRRPMTACNTIVSEGMRVNTDTPKVRSIREEVMKLVLMDHPLECPTCPAAGECEIQNLTCRLGIYGTEYPVAKRDLPPTRNWPLIEYNPNLCITCLRCVKVCHEVIGCGALALKDAGYAARIDTVDGNPLNCDFCGECVEACPSGAMSIKLYRSWARSWELRKTPTVCPLCTAGCRMELNVKDGKIFRVTSDLDSHNRGTLCAGGRFGYDVVHHEGRLETPLMRKNGALTPVSWQEALSFVSRELQRIIREAGPESIGGIASPRLTNEDLYAFQKLFRVVIGTNNIDSEARFGLLRVQRALELTCGAKGVTGSLSELLDTGAIFVIGVDPLEETPALGWQVKSAARQHDSNVIVANSRGTSLDRFARVRLRIRPYSESDLVLGMMKIILDLDLWDTKFVRDRTSNFLSMKNLLDKISLKGILTRTGVAGESLEGAARILAEANNASVIFGGDVILQEHGLQCVMNLANLALLTGNIGKPNAGIYPIFEKGNMFGLVDMGVLPEYLPGYQDTAAVRPVFERVWNRPLPYTKGRTVTEMARGLETGEVRGLYIAGADPATDYPRAGRFADAFAKAKLLIVQDLFLSPTARMAHCVFPVASFAEKEGTITNVEHRVQRLNQAIPPYGQSMPDWSIFEEVAKALGKPMGFFSARDIFREMTLTIPSFKGLRFQDLQGDGKIVRPSNQGSETLRGGKPYAFAPVRIVPAPETADARSYPFEMIAGRSMFHFGTTTTRSRNLSQLSPHACIEMNARDASAMDTADGDLMEVASPYGSFVAPVKVSANVSSGMIFVPTNFPSTGVYRLFAENTNVCRVRLSRPVAETGI